MPHGFGGARERTVVTIAQGPAGRGIRPRLVVARYRTAGPRALTGAPAGTNTDWPLSSVTSPSAEARTAEPSVHSTTCGPPVVSVPGSAPSWQRVRSKSSTGTG